MDKVLAKQNSLSAKSKMSTSALQYIQDHDLCDCLERNAYNLIGKDVVDTGIIENAILGRQDNVTERGYRVAKYLLQLVHSRKSSFVHDSIYGLEPDSKSCHLRSLFSNLLVHGYSTKSVKPLKEGKPAIYVLNMLYRVVSMKAIEDCMYSGTS